MRERDEPIDSIFHHKAPEVCSAMLWKRVNRERLFVVQARTLNMTVTSQTSSRVRVGAAVAE
jgi:hypothetical protein